jgi:hypothetical protein
MMMMHVKIACTKDFPELKQVKSFPQETLVRLLLAVLVMAATIWAAAITRAAEVDTDGT